MSSSEKLVLADLIKKDDVLASIGTVRKVTLLVVICFAEFLDSFSNSALFSAIPPICQQLGISNSDSVWLQSGYQLTFSALTLISGRLSDLYNPKWVFIIGGMSLGLLSLGSGFVRSEIPLFVLRGLMGVGAALTVPSALHMIVHMFPKPESRSNAMGFFSTAGAMGNLFGLIIGALFVSFASWHWVFYFIAIMGIAESVLVFFLCPPIPRPNTSAFDRAQRFKRLDILGVGSLTISLILFTFAVTSGSITGWGTARVIAPLVISLMLVIVFFLYEARIPEDMAAVPPRTWRYENFGVLIALGLLPYMWWGTVQSLYSWIWQEVYGWNTIITAVHFLPLGIIAIPVNIITTIMQQRMRLKWVMVIGNILAMIGSLLLPFGISRSRYWSIVFPGFVIGSGGVSITFVTLNVAIFVATPPEAAGVVAALFNCALQLGCAAGIAIITSIQTSVEATHGGPTSYDGRAAGFWFLFAATTTLTLSLLWFMKDTLPPMTKATANAEKISETPDEMGHRFF